MKNIILFFLIAMNCHFFYAQTVHNIINIDNTIHFKIYGEGIPILIINGGPGMNSNGFVSLAKKLGKNYKAIIYDQRGTGLSKLSKVNPKTITLDLMVSDIEKIREYLKIEKLIILGHSFGGMLASYYASLNPNRIKGLILSSSGGIDMELFSRINISSRLTKIERDSLNIWNHAISIGDTSYYARLQRGKYLAPAYLYDKSNLPIVAERLTQGNTLINRLVYQNMRKIGFDCSQGLRKLIAPVLIIQGEQDLVDTKTAEKAMKVFKKATLVIIEKCNHYGWLDNPKVYFENIHSFLLKLKKYN